MAELIDLVNWVKEKKELSALSDEIVEGILRTTISKQLIKIIEARSPSELRRNALAKEEIKQVRMVLRKRYGMFWQGINHERVIKMIEAGEPEDTILEMHPSTKERLPHYLEVYKEIFSRTGIPKKIVDHAAGLNPLSYKYMNCRPEYVATELAKKDTEIINAFFEVKKIKGNAYPEDIANNPDSITNYQGDVCFYFKALDGFEAVQRNISEKILENTPCRFLVCSFATKSLGGKKQISASKRTWLEHLAEEKGWKLESFEIPNELFYVIDKGSLS
ncbi:MAG: hypothetical protein ABIA93_02295 [Candidatus Woesearchaeota archaeon]